MKHIHGGHIIFDIFENLLLVVESMASHKLITTALDHHYYCYCNICHKVKFSKMGNGASIQNLLNCFILLLFESETDCPHSIFGLIFSPNGHGMIFIRNWTGAGF